MKKILLVLFMIPIINVIALLSWPEIVINKDNILWVLQREEISKELSWDSFEVKVKNRGVLKKEINIKSQNLCGLLNDDTLDLSYCLKEIDINIQVGTAQWPFVKTPKLSRIVFDYVKIHSWPERPEHKEVEEQVPIETVESWNDFWKLPLPKLKLVIQKIEFPDPLPVRDLSLDLKIADEKVKLSLLGVQMLADEKKVHINIKNWRPTDHVTLSEVKKLKDLNIKQLGIRLKAEDDHFQFKTDGSISSLRFGLRGKLPSVIDMEKLTNRYVVHEFLSELKMNLEIKEIKTLIAHIPKEFLPQEHSATLNEIGGSLTSKLQFDETSSNVQMNLQVSSVLQQNDKSLTIELRSIPKLQWQWPLKSNELIKDFMIGTKARIELDSIKKHLGDDWKETFEQLPSPLNNFNGPVTADYKAKAGKEDNDVKFEVKTMIKLQNGDQKLFIEINPQILFDTLAMNIKKTDVLLHFTDVRLKLPDINLTQAIPQFGPDSRISVKQTEIKKQAPVKSQKKENEGQLDLELRTPEDKPVKLSTNLLTSPVFIDLNLKILEGLPKGTVTIRPLQTTLFKREIQLKKTTITLSPTYSPVLETEVHFPVPNYLIILKIDGPVDEPRPLLSSRPPLPEDDIISVLLFGQPLSNLPENEQAGAANRTSQILSQGLLSLSVLYFLSDTPIQSIGVDPETQKVSAQIGLSNKSSLQLSTQEDGTQSVGIRRSIGKGWFIDTSVQKSTLEDESEQKNYGVLLERIISY